MKKKPKPKKQKEKPLDGGISPKVREYLSKACRLIWQRSSYARKLCLKSADGPDGFPRCSKCERKVPKVFADHMIPVGDILEPGFFGRLFCSSEQLQPLCDKCHKIKTRRDQLDIAAHRLRVEMNRVAGCWTPEQGVIGHHFNALKNQIEPLQVEPLSYNGPSRGELVDQALEKGVALIQAAGPSLDEIDI